MKINGMVHCFFEQSGTFKNEFKKLGIHAEDYDIQNQFGETDHVIDLFQEIDNAYMGGVSIFDNITNDDFIMAFYPCIFFSSLSQMCFSLTDINYRKCTDEQKFKLILERSKKREEFYSRLIRFCAVCQLRGLRMVFENPYSMQTYLKSNFLKPPTFVDSDRTKRGDIFRKPTGYWFWNCEPTHGCTIQKIHEGVTVRSKRGAASAGICSTERSMITNEYARNFICDFILGKPSSDVASQCDLFD